MPEDVDPCAGCVWPGKCRCFDVPGQSVSEEDLDKIMCDYIGLATLLAEWNIENE